MQWKFPLITDTTYLLPSLLFPLALLYYPTVLLNITVLGDAWHSKYIDCELQEMPQRLIQSSTGSINT